MKTINGIVGGFLLISAGLAQNHILNPAKPIHPDAGRALELQLVLEISDASGQFFFKRPEYFQLDEQNRLYILDEDQLLQFSPQGELIRNFYKKGQGPGEIATHSRTVSFVPLRDELVVFDGSRRITRFKMDGTPADDVSLATENLIQLIGAGNEGYYFLGEDRGIRFGDTAGFRPFSYFIAIVDPEGTKSDKIFDFSTRIYQGNDYFMAWNISRHAFNPRDESLYLSHTEEYRIEKIDLLNKKYRSSFARAYPRMKFSIPDILKDFYKKYDPPKKEFEDDIKGLYVCGDNLWVKTSTVTKGKGVLFDVFGSNGRFLDSFYLDDSLQLALADGNFIYATGTDQEGNIFVRKYRILE